MNECFSLAFDHSSPDDSHIRVRVFGHGALLGQLTLRREEEGCFKRLFYPDEEIARVVVQPGEHADVSSDAGLGMSPRWGYVVQKRSVLSVEPLGRCSLRPRNTATEMTADDYVRLL